MNCNKKNDDGRLWLLLIVAVLVMSVLMSLCGCKSVREAQEYKELFRMENEQVTMMRDSIDHLHKRINVLTHKLEISDSVRTVSKDSTDTKEKIEVYIRDSSSTKQVGDTVFVDRWHWDTRNYQLLQTQFRLDSISQNRRIAELQDYVSILQDSITVINEKLKHQTVKQTTDTNSETEVVIEKPIPWWVRALACIGGLCLVAFGIMAIMMYRARKGVGGNDW